MNYESFKNIINASKPLLVTLGCLLGSFSGGYLLGSGAYEDKKPSQRQLNYTTNPSKPTDQTVSQKSSQIGANNSVTANCVVKGNIASGGKKTYHVQGGSFYDRTTAEICFGTEAEAITAGFIKSSR